MRNKMITAIFLRLRIYMKLIRRKLKFFLIKLKTLFVYLIDHYPMASMPNILELAPMMSKICNLHIKSNLVSAEGTGLTML